MKGIDMYCRIQVMKGNGISRRKTVEYLGINGTCPPETLSGVEGDVFPDTKI